MGKQTNWEWYVENEPEKLKGWCIFTGAGKCSLCLAEEYCAMNQSKSCPTNRSTWLDLPHKAPDSLEKCEEDKFLPKRKYWKCTTSPCAECPAIIDGDTPKIRYGVFDCATAQGIDIARRIVALGGEL